MNKRIIFDVGHPAQVHHFKNIYWELEKLGWEGLFTVKDKEVAIHLLDNYKLPYSVVGKNKSSLLKKVISIPKECLSFLKVLNKFKPDIVLSRSSIHSTWMCKVKGIPNIAFADTEHTETINKVTIHLTSAKLTAFSYQKDLGKNHLRYKGNIELFYLHPKRFSPDVSIRETLNLAPNERYAIVRFVSWNAHHDVGEQGLKIEHKIQIIKDISSQMRVFITAENTLPEELMKYQISIPPDKMHDALAYASLYIGEGGTMASEAAMLGVASIYINSLDAGVFVEQVQQGLLHSFRDANGVMDTIHKILNQKNFEVKYQKRRDMYMDTVIDPTLFVIWFVENYPESRRIMKENSDYQYNFK